MKNTKQMQEMARVMHDRSREIAEDSYGLARLEAQGKTMSDDFAEALYNAGYRKASEVAREIFEEIENAHEECIHIDPSTNIGYLLQSKFELKLAELKKKYTEDGK